MGAAAIAFALGLSVIVTFSALAAPPASKPYSAVLVPATGGAALEQVTRTLVITNETVNNGPDFGWVHVAVENFANWSASAPILAGWTRTYTPDGFILSTNSSEDRLSSGESVSVILAGTLPCSGSARFVTDTAQANQGQSPGNRWSLQGSQPSIPVNDLCHLEITEVSGGAPPVPGDPVVVGEPFSVTVELQTGSGQPIAAPFAIDVALSETGPGALDPLVPAGTISQGASEVTIPVVKYTVAANDVILTATSSNHAEIPSDTETIDVLTAFERINTAPGQAAEGGTCDDTHPASVGGPTVCVRFDLPNGAESSSATISIAVCTGIAGAEGCNGDALAEALADFGKLYTFNDPFGISIEYDKSLKVTNKDQVFFELEPGQGFVASNLCRDDPLDADTFLCTQGVHGDGAGDRIFEVVGWKDIRLGSK